MRLPASERARWALIVLAGAVALAALNLWWILTYRQGFPLNVDEAEYISIAVTDHLGLQNGGWHGWWSTIQSQTPNAPLVPAITSVLLIVKSSVTSGFVALIGFFVLLTLATYGIGERLAGPRLGALSALVVATSEGAILFTREYIFALPAAALTSCAVYALLRSERMRSRRWAVACGLALGLMLLARTMAVAFVPGILAAALLGMLATDRTDLGRRFLNFGLTVATGIAVAATWYIHNWKPVYDYLTSFGYGAQSAYYGVEHSVISWARFRGVAERMIYNDLLIPLTGLLLIALVVLVALAVRQVLAADDRRQVVLELATSDAVAVAVVFVAGFSALMSSRNGGNGFTLPLSMLLPPLAVAALRPFRIAVAPVGAILTLIAALNLAATSNLWKDLSKPRLVSVPAFGYLPWVNGTPHTVEAIRVQDPGPADHFTERDHRWQEANDALATLLLEQIEAGVVSPVVTFASRNRAISGGSVEVACLLNHDNSILFAQLNAEPDDTVAVYRRQLSDPQFGLPGMLVTMSRNSGDFPPLVTQSRAEAAARALDFRRIRSMTLPDGRQLRVWRKAGAQPAGGSHPVGPGSVQRPASSAPNSSTDRPAKEDGTQ
jgi:4-amino-4-deoxy-L-arabinose transferase-like glycosyltransferase